MAHVSLPLAMLLLLCCQSLLLCYAIPSGLRITLTHIDSLRNLTKLQRHQLAVERSKNRVAALTATKTAASPGTGLQTPVLEGRGEFFMELFIGTPPTPLLAITDTGSDLIWTQCQPCLDCYNQPVPIYDPMSSSTFSRVSCNTSLCQALESFKCIPSCEYYYSYGGGASTRGVLATETFTFGTDERVSIPAIGFGCGNINQVGYSNVGFSGLVGLGRNPLSLISQLGFGKFSYCLTPYGESKSSPLFLGSLAGLGLNDVAPMRSTPLVVNPVYPSFYFLNLQGITVGTTRLPIPTEAFEIKKNGSGGLIIDSGTTYTQLEESAFQLVKEQFQSLVKLPIANVTGTPLSSLEVCFSFPPNATLHLPKLVFHFENADWELPEENSFMFDSEARNFCLAIMRARSVSIFGNYQQQNMHVIYDLVAEKLFFAPAKCDQL